MARRELRHAHMLVVYGKGPDRKCGDCACLKVVALAKKFHKCRLYGETNGPATDWNTRWDACGAFADGTPFTDRAAAIRHMEEMLARLRGGHKLDGHVHRLRG